MKTTLNRIGFIVVFGLVLFGTSLDADERSQAAQIAELRAELRQLKAEVAAEKQRALRREIKSYSRRKATEDRMQRQILQHGAGGCTPNFSTGGCL